MDDQAGCVKVFCGYDPRQPLAYNVLQHSIHRNSKRRIIIEPLMLEKLPLKRRGLTAFTYSRFLVPWLCDFAGRAIFLDSDIVVTGDIGELWDQADGLSSVQVMRDQARFEWPSVMLFNCEHCKMLTPEYIETAPNPLMLDWGSVGSFAPEWAHLVGYMEPKEAKLYHYTQGLPCWYETAGLPEDEAWYTERKALTQTVSWMELMGNSVHAQPVKQRLMERLNCRPSS